ncbi:TPA: 4-hydroxy-3-methylbut-2-en-1-yl diphosphate synthase [bacterium]|nr:4-hydroxy-3-methylbut-2-en-1-yl diphosphate synthase [bacterium]
MRRKSLEATIGNIRIGGKNPIAIQSMTKTKTKDVIATVEQILELSDSGCEIIRVALPDITSAKVLGKIKEKSPMPIIADIHFNYKIALEAIEQGADKIRLNPGNIRNKEKIKEIVKKAKKARIPIRVGANSGSLPNGETLVSAVMREIKILEEEEFYDIVVSLKGVDIHQTVAGYREMAKLVKYPFHIGITEAGPLFSGSIISSIGCGIILFEGLGDTIRVSLTSSPVDEVKVAKQILQALDIRSFGPRIISCPGCGRAKQEFFKISYELESIISKIEGLSDKKIAIMGCEVNGPGEAKKADFGIVCGRIFTIYKDGRIINKTSSYNTAIKIMEENLYLR